MQQVPGTHKVPGSVHVQEMLGSRNGGREVRKKDGSRVAPGALLQTCPSPLMLPAPTRRKGDYLHSTDEEMGAQQSAAACSRSHSQKQQIPHLNQVCLPQPLSCKQLPELRRWPVTAVFLLLFSEFCAAHPSAPPPQLPCAHHWAEHGVPG